MRLVDRKQSDIRALEERERLTLQQALGRHVDETQFPARDLVDDGAVLRRFVGRIQARRGDAVSGELRHLVAHQRD